MKELFRNTDEFYVGYLSTAPSILSKQIKLICLIIGVIVILSAMVVGFSQRAFSTSTFEYGIATSIEGTIYISPVPHLRITIGRTQEGKTLYQNILLVGSGKSGVENVVKLFEKKLLVKIHGKHVKLTGYLIYADGKALLQLNDDSNFEVLGENHSDKLSEIKSSDNVTINGEVVDPKCYFGVMKPAEGKVHRSCAIRCIEGGIPPVFKSNLSDFFLLVGENFEPVNHQVINLVGDNIQLKGELIEVDDWKILKVKTGDLEEISSAVILERNLRAMENGISRCMN